MPLFRIDIRFGTKSDGIASPAKKANVKCLNKLDFDDRIDILPAYRAA